MTAELIDTNILVYAADSSNEEKHAKIVKWLELQKNKSIGKIFISIQNLREFSSVCHQKKIIEINNWISVFEESFMILDDSSDDIKLANIWTNEINAHFWDAIIAATMKRNGITTIYTENTKDFAKFPGIKAVNPLKH